MITAPRPEVIVLPDALSVALEAATRTIARLAESKRPSVCLTGGSSPKRLYELLGTSCRDEVAWSKVDWFLGDERFVPLDHPQSNMGAAKALFLDRCAPPARIHPIPTHDANPELAALRYERELRSFYGSDRLDPAKPLFDVVLMGLGPDGHTASLFPDVSIDDPDRWAIGVARANVAPFVPRVTLTYSALASCREMLFLVTGAEKRAILSKVLQGEELPATHMHSEGQTTWLVDRAAAGERT